MEILDLIDEQNNVIGTAPRDEVHAKGLLHREVHVWFYTPDGKIIWQRRAAHKDFGNMLDATVGGHVSSGQSYEEAAIREMAEETGISVDINQLEFECIQQRFHRKPDGSGNNFRRASFYYKFTGDIANLQVEKTAGAGFEAFTLEQMKENIGHPDRSDFLPRVLKENFPHFQKKLAGLA